MGPSRPASPWSLRHTPTHHQGLHWPPPGQAKTNSRPCPSPALRVPRSSPPLPLPPLLLSTCLPELAEPPSSGESISLLFEAFFDLLTIVLGQLAIILHAYKSKQSTS